MNNRIITVFAVALFALSPVAASAATTGPNPQLANLVQELNILLNKINVLDTSSHAHMNIMPAYGVAPFTTLFTLTATSSTESLDFGDGHSTGSAGCTKNALGYCALPAVIGHTYRYPGLYAVTLYDRQGTKARVIANSLVYAW